MTLLKAYSNYIKILLIIFIFVSFSCTSHKQNYIFIEGFAQGGTFHITYQPNPDTILTKEIYQLLTNIDRSLSIYDSTSIISKVNQPCDSIEVDRFFTEVFRSAYKIYQLTDGAFDITVAPLVKYWGFLSPDTKITNRTIEDIMPLIGMDKLLLHNNVLIKKNKNMQIDVNAIAQGYTVDKLAMLLESRNIQNYMIEVGGEVRVKGKNPNGNLWRIGIDKPIENSNEYNREIQTIIQITDISLATSGSYRKFIEKDKQKLSHTINPLTGFPTNHNLLSVTIFHSSAAEADALATAIMVMGLNKGIQFVKENNLSAYFIYSEPNGTLKTWMTNDIKKYISYEN